MNYILIKSKNKNNYIYSFNKKQTLLIHPLISFFLNLKTNKYDIKDWIKENVKNKNEIEEIGVFNKKEVLYYYYKYLFLLKNDYFIGKYVDNSYRYNSENIKYHLANTSQISFEVTDKCNLQCEYCIYGKYYMNRTKPENINLSIDTAKKILENLVKLWNTSLNSSENKKISIGFYGGEPLLNMEFIHEIVDYVKTLKTNHYSFSYDMTTNGVLLAKNIQFLEENKFNIVISLDGGTEINNSYRIFKNNKQPAFKNIYNNILEIRSKYPQYFKEYINFNSVLHNKNSFSEIYEFPFQTEFSKTPLVSELDRDSITPNLKDAFLTMQKSINDSIHNDNNNLLEIEKEHYVGVVDDLRQFLFGYSGYVKSDYLDLLFNYPNKRNYLQEPVSHFQEKYL